MREFTALNFVHLVHLKVQSPVLFVLLGLLPIFGVSFLHFSCRIKLAQDIVGLVGILEGY